MNTTTATETEIRIAKLTMVHAYATAGIAKLEDRAYDYHWNLRDATAAARTYAKLANRDFLDVRDEMLGQFIFPF